MTFMLAEQSSLTFFAKRGRDRRPSSLFPIFDMLIRSKYFCGQTLKLFEILPNIKRCCLSIFREKGGQVRPKVILKFLCLPGHVT